MLVAAVLSLILALSASAAFAQTSYNEPPGPEIEAEEVSPSEAGPSELGDDGGGVLPFTGADITLFAVIGLSAIGTGAVIVRRTRSHEV
jgi:LPXTG-motif cell wall-anchored protein